MSTEVKPQDPVVVHTTEFSLNEVVKLSPRALLLDNAATASVVNRADMLYDLTQADYSVSITGLSGESMLTDVRGKIIGLDVQAWLCKEARGNIVVFGHLDEAYDVEHLKRKGFLIRRRGKQDVFFEKRRCDKLGNALYVYNVPEHRLMAVTSVEENKLGYSKRELTDAVRARELSARVAYPSNKDLAELLTTGGIINCPVTAHDVARAEKIFGPDIAVLKGKTPKRKSLRIKLVPVPETVLSTKVQNLHCDVMFVDSLPYLLTVSEPLGLRMVKLLDGGKRDAKAMYDAFVCILKEYESRGFSIDYVFFDGEKPIAAAKGLLASLNVRLNTSSANKHVPIAERAIRQIKERIRAVATTLPYACPLKLMPYLVDFVVRCINLFPKTTALERVSPREMFTGIKLDYHRDLRVTFGAYAQIEVPHAESNDPRAARTEGAISLLPRVDVTSTSWGVARLSNVTSSRSYRSLTR